MLSNNILWSLLMSVIIFVGIDVISIYNYNKSISLWYW